MKRLKDIKQEYDVTIVYKFLILIFMFNMYVSGINIGYIILMAVLLFISLKIMMHIK